MSPWLRTPLAASALAIAVFATNAAPAELVTFDPTGQGGASGSILLGGFDWAPGNALAVDALPIGTVGEPTAFTTYYQSTLAAFVDPGGNPIADTGLGTDYQITIQAGVPELGALTDSLILFGHDPDGPVNFLRLYYSDTVGTNASTGEGFDRGEVILEAVFTGNDTFFDFSLTEFAPLDLFEGNQQAGYGSVVGAGFGPIYGDVVSTDGDFFVGDELTRFVLETVQTTPFAAVEPTGPETAAEGVIGNIPAIFGNVPDLASAFPDGVNGLPVGCEEDMPCDVLLQSDTFLRFGEVNEPAGLTLGAGLIALGCALGRRLKPRAGRPAG